MRLLIFDLALLTLVVFLPYHSVPMYWFGTGWCGAFALVDAMQVLRLTATPDEG